MGVRTYIPGLLLVLNAAYRYITRYNTKLAESLSPEQFAHLTSCLADLATCLQEIPPPPVEPNA